MVDPKQILWKASNQIQQNHRCWDHKNLTRSRIHKSASFTEGSIILLMVSLYNKSMSSVASNRMQITPIEQLQNKDSATDLHLRLHPLNSNDRYYNSKMVPVQNQCIETPGHKRSTTPHHHHQNANVTGLSMSTYENNQTAQIKHTDKSSIRPK
jgi:hypothetical protein